MRRLILAVLLLFLLVACSNGSDTGLIDEALVPDGDTESSDYGNEADNEEDETSETPDGDIEASSDGDEDTIEDEIEMEQEAELPPDPGLDRYYGSLWREWEDTGYFRVQKDGDTWWLVTPEGHPYFAAGFNVVGPDGTATADGVKHYRETVDAKYDDLNHWAREQVRRHEEWGFTSIGSWSRWELFQYRFPFTKILYVSGSDWLEGNLVDYFSPDFEARVQDIAEREAKPMKDNPYLIGYFLDNEMHWGPDWRGSHLFPEYFALSAEAPGKQRLIQYLQENYINLEALKTDFETEATTWEELAETIEMPSKKTDNAYAIRTAWTGIVAERFFSLTDTLLKEADPNHLNLGVRFVSQLVARAAITAAGKYVDVMSINWYEMIGDLESSLQSWDVDNLSVYGDLIEHYEAGGKPILVSEWGYRAADSGLPNSYPPIYPTLETQADRAAEFTSRLERMLAAGYFVGHHWFLYVDQPAEGRFDGEDNNFGFLAENDEPYPELVEAAKAIWPQIYGRLAKISE